ncbi:MAG: glycosyltransferase family 39 protein [Deltaproteobacteria bacterium]|nr:glycosyltransferase family 39 protein [Deltaproteobacteria bacterium]
MTNALTERLKSLRVVLLLALAVGAYFRLSHLDRKVYWNDEAGGTSRWIAGFTTEEVSDELAARGPVSVNDLARYQRVNLDKGLLDTLRVVASREPHHAPLYAMLAWIWAHAVGDSVRALRALSALISFLQFPALWWLCRELFPQRRSTAIVALALLAVSPLQVLYAQEARAYSLWALAILLSSAALLRALRVGSPWAWRVYAGTLVLGWYVHLLFGLVAIGHVLFAVVSAGWRDRTLRTLLRAQVIGALAMTPWFVVLLVRYHNAVGMMAWVGRETGFVVWTKSVILNLTCIVFDARVDREHAMGLAAVLALALLVFALGSLWRNGPRRAWWFVVALSAPTVLALGVPDIVTSGARLSTARYAMPAYFAVHLALAQLLASGMSDATRALHARAWAGITAAVLLAGVVSCARSWTATTCWIKALGFYNREVARIIEQSPHSLLLTDATGLLLSLSHSVRSDFRVWYVAPPVPAIPDGYGDVFVLSPSDVLRAALEAHAGWQMEPVHEPGRLWRLRRVPTSR